MRNEWWTDFCSKGIKWSVMDGATISLKSLEQNKSFYGNSSGPSKINLLQSYVVLWIRVIDAIWKLILLVKNEKNRMAKACAPKHNLLWQFRYDNSKKALILLRSMQISIEYQFIIFYGGIKKQIHYVTGMINHVKVTWHCNIKYLWISPS